MIRITRNIRIEDKKLIGNARYIKRYLVTTIWFLFIPLLSTEKLLKNPEIDLPEVDNGSDYPKAKRVYVPSKDENRILEGKEECNFEN